MSAVISDIKPGMGLGNIEFGMSREDLKALLGNPEEIEKYNLSEEEGDNSEAWHYDEFELSASFEEFYDWQLVSIAVSGEDYKLHGKKLIGKDKATVLDILEDLAIGKITEETEEDLDMISIEEMNLNFYFEDEELSEIQFGPIFEDEE